jgi:hypothetical protein
MKKTILMLLTALLLVVVGSYAAPEESCRFDNDVGISISNDIVICPDAQIIEANPIITAEIEISHGDTDYIISATSDVPRLDEMLQGSLYNINNQDLNSKYTLNTSKRILNYNSHFRLSRSRLV